MIKNVTIGADPELFLYDIYKNRNISAERLIGGSKNEPMYFKKGHALQEDNVAVEFNIPATSNINNFVKSINTCKNFINLIIPDNTIQDIVPYVEFEEIELLTEASVTFGCSPSFNVFSNTECTANPERNPLARTAAGHIHIGYDNPNDIDSTNIVKMIDMFVSMPILLEDELSRKRLTVYGLNGDCRFKNYGVEARSPSNWWIKTPNRIKWVFNQIQQGIEMINKGVNFSEFDNILNNYEFNNYEKAAEELKIKLITNKIKI